MEKKKKIIYGSIMVLLIALLVVSSFIAQKDRGGLLTDDATSIFENAQRESKQVENKKTKKLIEMNASSYLESYQAQDKKIVLIGRPTCQYSAIVEPILKGIAKDYNLDIYYLNTDELTPEDQDAIVASDEFFKDGLGTPILLIIGEGKIIDKVDGLTDTAHYIDFFNTNGYIK